MLPARSSSDRSASSWSARWRDGRRGRPASSSTTSRFSRAVRNDTRFTDWKTNPIVSRRKSVSLRLEKPVMSVPSTTTRPSVGLRMPPAIEHSVVLPEPDGPMRATISPRSTRRSTASTAVMSVSPTR
jgi:hypothetical protein